MERKIVFKASLLASIVALFSALIMIFGITIPEAGMNLQPSYPPCSVSEFVRPVNEHPELVLRFMAVDSVFILGYLMVFVGLFTATVDRSRMFAGLGLSSGILTAFLDATENSFFITYSLLALKKIPLTDPELPLIFILASMKWMSAFVAIASFGLVWKRDNWLSWAISITMLVFVIVGVLGIFLPGLIGFRGLFFVLGMLLFAWYFFREEGKT